MSAILERIKEAYQLKTDAEVADFLGLKPSTLSMQKNRGRLNIQRIIQKCSDLNKNWLLDGHGKMKKKEMKTVKNRIPVYSSLSIENQVPDFRRSIKAGNIFADVTEELQEFTSSDQIIGYVVPENSLAPTLKKGDIAIVNLDYSLSKKNICLVSADHGVGFRRFTSEAILDNKIGVGESLQTQSYFNGFKIIGRLVWVMRRITG